MSASDDGFAHWSPFSSVMVELGESSRTVDDDPICLYPPPETEFPSASGLKTFFESIQIKRSPLKGNELQERLSWDVEDDTYLSLIVRPLVGGDQRIKIFRPLDHPNVLKISWKPDISILELRLVLKHFAFGLWEQLYGKNVTKHRYVQVWSCDDCWTNEDGRQKVRGNINRPPKLALTIAGHNFFDKHIFGKTSRHRFGQECRITVTRIDTLIFRMLSIGFYTKLSGVEKSLWYHKEVFKPLYDCLKIIGYALPVGQQVPTREIGRASC